SSAYNFFQKSSKDSGYCSANPLKLQIGRGTIEGLIQFSLAKVKNQDRISHVRDRVTVAKVRAQPGKTQALQIFIMCRRFIMSEVGFMDRSDQRPVIIRLVFACPFSVLKGIDLLKCCRADAVGSGL